MMSVLFVGMLALSLVCALFNGRIPQLSAAALSEGANAVTLVLQITGGICLWSGLMELAEASRLTRQLARAFSPLTRLLFRGLREDSPAMGAISMNMTANLLGLGNAATPLGITAMQALEREEHTGARASDNMVLFVVLNTASMQLLPTTTALLRLQAGSADPMGILPAVWLSSLLSVASGVLIAKLLAGAGGRKHG